MTMCSNCHDNGYELGVYHNTPCTRCNAGTLVMALLAFISTFGIDYPRVEKMINHIDEDLLQKHGFDKCLEIFVGRLIVKHDTIIECLGILYQSESVRSLDSYQKLVVGELKLVNPDVEHTINKTRLLDCFDSKLNPYQAIWVMLNR